MSLIELKARAGRARVETRGGTVVSWEPELFGEVLAQARRTDIGRLDTDVHGGIPVCWPWAVYEGEPGCRIHGLARYGEWSVVSRSDASVVLALTDDEETRKAWPYRFRLELACRLSDCLEVEFRATNADTRPFACTELFHPYFRVGDVRRCRVTGTDGAHYFWRREEEAGDRRVWSGDFDGALFQGGAPGYVFTETGLRHVLTDPVLGRELDIAYSGNRKLVVWGVGGDFSSYGTSDDPDFGKRFLCVEGGTLYRDCAYALAPGETHRLKMTVCVRTMK